MVLLVGILEALKLGRRNQRGLQGGHRRYTLPEVLVSQEISILNLATELL